MEKISGYVRDMVRTRVAQEISKPLLGKPYLKFGQCQILWAYCFQLGGILSAKHSANLDAFGAAFLGARGEPGAINRFFDEIAGRVLNSSLRDSVRFGDYVTSEFMRRLKYSGDVASFLLGHMAEKLDPKTASELAYQYSIDGAAFGATDPDGVREMFDRTYAPVAEQEWEFARRSGLDIPLKQVMMSYEEMQEAEDEMFMLYCQERCPDLFSVLISDEDENAEGMLEVANRTLAEDEGIGAKLLAYQEAITTVIEIDNGLFSTCRNLLRGYGANGLLLSTYADVLTRGTVENSRSRKESDLPASREEIRKAIIGAAELAVTRLESDEISDLLKALYSSLSRFMPDSQAAVVTSRNVAWFSETPVDIDDDKSEEADQIEAAVNENESRLEEEFDSITLDLLQAELSKSKRAQTRVANQMLQAFSDLSPEDPKVVDDLLQQEYCKLELDEGSLDRNVRDGIVAWRHGEREKALRLLNDAIEIDPEDGGALLNRGNLKLEMGLFEEGIRDLERAGDIDPGLPWQNALVFKMLSPEEREQTRQTMLRKNERK
jgi:hypothetical protein